MASSFIEPSSETKKTWYFSLGSDGMRCDKITEKSPSSSFPHNSLSLGLTWRPWAKSSTSFEVGAIDFSKLDGISKSLIGTESEVASISVESAIG